MPKLLPILLFLILSGCGTAVFEHKFEVTLNDPTERLGPEPEVSIFDNVMGYSDEWARRTMGTAAAGRPYAGRVSATDMKTVFDRTPPAMVQAGLALPALEQEGHFVLQIKPVAGPEQTTEMPYKSYTVPTAAEDQIKPLTARFTGTPSSKGWTIRLTVDVPPAPTDPVGPRKP
jgi:hypothetical protein